MNASSKTNRSESESEAADLAAEIAALKQDLTDLASTLRRAGVRRVGKLRSEAETRVSQGLAAGGDALEDIEHEIESLENDLTDHIRRKPLQSIGIAAVVGFFLAMFLRR